MIVVTDKRVPYPKCGCTQCEEARDERMARIEEKLDLLIEKLRQAELEKVANG